jgi:hypothetical protein
LQHKEQNNTRERISDEGLYYSQDLKFGEENVAIGKQHPL